MYILTKSNKNNLAEWLEIARNDGAFCLVDKSLDWTSFDVVAKLRGMLKIKKIGHAGTLDPLATGLLIIAFGKATKQIELLQNKDKIYSAVFKIGATTKTDDSEAEEENIKNYDYVNDELILDTAKQFIGKISQVPPIFSAKSIGGKRLYKLARKNIEIDIPAVEININSIDIKNINLPFIELDVDCSKGTYIRSLARDFGDKLNCGAYLYKLRRTAIADFKVDDALTIHEIAEIYDSIANQLIQHPLEL